ncbi:MAG: pyrimidine dimer DNA glycosylase/endonuclease V [Candidatus Nanoarchaeia archaeon]|nr:pyrimidine dimer DNA glycosylase/endonuclease V [Candidatus Nanoarchaeia archaeon]
MVRVNIISPKLLSDQHLLAEHLEIIMLISYARKNPPAEIPARYCLGKGHIIFFKNKIRYLQKRHLEIQKEMKNRGFKPKAKLDLKGVSRKLLNDWIPVAGDEDVIKKRILWKIRNKPSYYRYYGEKKPLSFFDALLK